MHREPLSGVVARVAQPLRDSEADFAPALELARGKGYVLLGEASHGTHEFYHIRAELTRRLIQQQGFRAVVIEGDWPDAHRVNRYVKGQSRESANQALSGFQRFPQWMWRNGDVLQFVEWLREFNRLAQPHRVAGFYGMDLYSLHASMDAVVSYLRGIDPEAAKRAARRYACFDRYGEEPQEYGYATAIERQPSCENDVVQQLRELQVAAISASGTGEGVEPDDLFFAQQNARVVVESERYYRTMYRGNAASWNLRDSHMASTIDAIVTHLERQHEAAKAVVWAHNSHLGDASATDMGRRGEHNVGQLLRESHGDDVLSIGFTTYSGNVAAADDWGEPVRRKRVRPGLSGSYEALFHSTGVPRFFLDLQDERVRSALAEPRLERAIGVIYRPETERASHYFGASLSNQFDAVYHIDYTSAVEPLEPSATWTPADAAELPETYPSGI
jgi:erythromycin esterase-like protein